MKCNHLDALYLTMMNTSKREVIHDILLYSNNYFSGYTHIKTDLSKSGNNRKQKLELHCISEIYYLILT